MKIEGRETVRAARAAVWKGLNDPAVLKSCTPGMTRLEETRPDHFEATLELKLPALQGRFDGHVDILERAEPDAMKLRLQGKGAPGFVNGGVDLKLEAPDADTTTVAYTADVQIGGTIARLGQRMLSGVTKEMAGQFFEAFERSQESPAGGTVAERAAPNPLFAALQLAWRTLLNLLGLSRRS